MYRKVLGRFEDEAQQVDFFSTIVDSLPVAVFCKDAENDMRVILWNKNAERMFGYLADDIIGKSGRDYLPPEAAERYYIDDYLAVKEDRTLFEADRTLVNPTSGETVIFSIWKVPVKTKRGTLLLCIAKDETAIRRAELESRSRERQLQSVSLNSPGLLYQFKVDAEKNFSFPFFSSKASEVLGIKAEAITKDANAIIGLIHEDDMAGFRQSLVETMTNISPWVWEGRFKTVEKGVRWFQGASTPALQEDGVTILWDGILLDVTSQKEAEERLRLQEAQLVGTSKLVALGEMAGGVAHEINTPLNAILFCAEQIQHSLKEENVDKDEMLELSGLILQTSQRIAKIVRGLKSFARDGSNEEFEAADIEVLIDETLSLCGQRMMQSGVKLTFVKPKDSIMASCRSVQMSQVILNLLNNSFDAVVGTKDPWIKLEIKSDSKMAYIVVTDSGAGLSAEVRAKLFQPFFTTKALGKGTGIGLSISRGIIEAHRGKLYVDQSSPNTKFIVEIPLEVQLQVAI